MTSNPLVSVVIPTFNHAKLLQRALDSVITQTFSNWEAIVVNNFSTDNTTEVIKSFKDVRISLINFSNHGVIGASRNQGINAARGEFVAFLDSDDVWYPEKLRKCVEQTAQGAQMVCHGELWISSDLSTREVIYGPASRAKYQSLLFRGNCISTSATLVTTSLLRFVNGFDESEKIVTAEDYDLWIRLAATNPKIVFIPEILGEFHRLSGSASSAVERNLAAEAVVLEKHFADQPPTFVNKLKMRHRLAIAHYGAARQLYGRPRDALKLFVTAWRHSPFFFRIYPGLMILAKKTLIKKSK